MRLYNAIAEGTLQEGENLLAQVFLVASGGTQRARVSSWSASFNGLIAGNSMTIQLTRESAGGVWTEGGDPVVLDGTHHVEYDATGGQPYVRWGATTIPSVDRVLDGPFQVSDPSYLFRQYASGQEPIFDSGNFISLRCTPVGMVAPVSYKVNITFRA